MLAQHLTLSSSLCILACISCGLSLLGMLQPRTCVIPPLFWWNFSLGQGYRLFPNAEIPSHFQALIHFCQASCQIHVSLGPSAPKEGTGGTKVLSPLLKAAPQWPAWLGMPCASRVTWSVINKGKNKRAELPLEWHVNCAYLCYAESVRPGTKKHHL